MRQTTIPIHAEAIPRGVQYWCDPAQPESIAQLRTLGHEARACVHKPTRGASGETKKPVLSGIDMVSERIRTGRLRIVRHACLPLVRELSMYHYDPAKQSEEPIKEDEHLCDALRYLTVGLDRRRGPSSATMAAIEEHERTREAREQADAVAEEAAHQARADAIRDDPFARLRPR